MLSAQEREVFGSVRQAKSERGTGSLGKERLAAAPSGATTRLRPAEEEVWGGSGGTFAATSLRTWRCSSRWVAHRLPPCTRSRRTVSGARRSRTARFRRSTWQGGRCRRCAAFVDPKGRRVRLGRRGPRAFEALLVPATSRGTTTAALWSS